MCPVLFFFQLLWKTGLCFHFFSCEMLCTRWGEGQGNQKCTCGDMQAAILQAMRGCVWVNLFKETKKGWSQGASLTQGGVVPSWHVQGRNFRRWLHKSIFCLRSPADKENAHLCRRLCACGTYEGFSEWNVNTVQDSLGSFPHKNKTVSDPWTVDSSAQLLSCRLTLLSNLMNQQFTTAAIMVSGHALQPQRECNSHNMQPADLFPNIFIFHES